MSGFGRAPGTRKPVLPRRRKGLSPQSRLIVGILGLTMLVGSGLAVVEFARDPLRFPVSNVDILGTVDYLDRDRLQADLVQFMEKGFYGLDIDDVRRSVERSPWVASARVRRIWPSRIEVLVEEHEPSARWNDNQLLSKQLELFSPPQLQSDTPDHLQWRKVFATLPLIRGVDGQHPQLLDAWREYQHALSRFGLSLAELIEDERGSRTLLLSNQVTVRLGNAEQSLRMQRFLDVYERMAEQIGAQERLATATFDMRYSNGFALGGIDGNQRADADRASTGPVADALNRMGKRDG